jgi:UDP-glucuronate decarboxylase
MKPLELVTDALRGTDEVFAVTGATGWFGSVALELLYGALGDQAAHRVVGYASAPRVVTLSDGTSVMVRPLADLHTQDPAPTTLLHCAFLTRDKLGALGRNAYTARNVAITATVVDAIVKHRPRHVVSLSSGAVYADTSYWDTSHRDTSHRDTSHRDTSHRDTSHRNTSHPDTSGRGAPRSAAALVSDVRVDPYGTLKNLDELVFRAATRDAGGACVIPRVFSVAGPRMTKPGLFALGSLIEMAAVGGPIEVRSRGRVFRSYCGVEEVLALALWAALRRRDLVFDTSGTVVEIGELARLVAHQHGLGSDVVRRSWDPKVTADRYVGDGTQMDALAAEARLDLQPLSELVRETSSWLTAGRPKPRVPARRFASRFR